MQRRHAIRNHIENNGRKFSIRRTWKEAGEAQSRGILVESTAGGFTNWFYIDGEDYLWWIFTDSSDGGAWSTDGITVYGYRVSYHANMATILNDLVKEQSTE